MSFKVFQSKLPEIYLLADQVEQAMDMDHTVALKPLKEIGRLLMKRILANENVEPDDSEPFILLTAIMKMDILPIQMMTTLKQLEYLDTRESSIFIELNQVENLFFGIYDLTSWFYRTFIDDQFTPPPLLLKPRVATLTIPSHHEGQSSKIKSTLYIDDKAIEGNWLNEMENVLSITYERGETYRGQVKKGLKWGTGVYHWSDGSNYEGQWFNDSEHGFGVKEYANGDRYQGEWREGLFHGNGIYKWQDGTTFEGGWQDHLEHGYGVKVHRDGFVQKGFWIKGELVFHKDQLNESKPLIADKE